MGQQSEVLAGIYQRISLDSEKKGMGVARQNKACRQFCDLRGWPVVDVYEDNDISASQYSRKKRPGYERMLEDIHCGRINVIVAYNADRLYRKPRELEDLIDLFTDAGVRHIATCDGLLDLGSEMGRAFARILGAMHAQASDATSRRLRDKWLERAERGLKHGQPPYGYEKNLDEPEKVLTRVESEARVIREEMRLRGGGFPPKLGCCSTARAITAREARPCVPR